MAYLAAERVQDLLGDNPIGALERKGHRDRLGHKSEPTGGAGATFRGFTMRLRIFRRTTLQGCSLYKKFLFGTVL